MLNLEAVGAGDEWCLKKAWKPDTRLERILRNAMRATIQRARIFSRDM